MRNKNRKLLSEAKKDLELAVLKSLCQAPLRPTELSELQAITETDLLRDHGCDLYMAEKVIGHAKNEQYRLRAQNLYTPNEETAGNYPEKPYTRTSPINESPMSDLKRMLNEKQIRWRVRSHLRTALLREAIVKSRVGCLFEQKEKEAAAEKKADQEMLSMMATVNQAADKLLKKAQAADQQNDHDLNEVDPISIASAYGGVIISMAGITKLLGWFLARVHEVIRHFVYDGKEEGQQPRLEKAIAYFFSKSHKWHHAWEKVTEKIAGMLGVPEGPKRKKAGKIIFTLILGAAFYSAATGAVQSVSHGHVAHAAQEGALSGIKASEINSLLASARRIKGKEDLIEAIQAAFETAGLILFMTSGTAGLHLR